MRPHRTTLIALGLVATLAACSSTATDPASAPDTVYGNWSSTADGSYFSSLTFSVRPSADSSRFAGTGSARVRQCGAGQATFAPYPGGAWPCQLDGLVIDGTQVGNTVTITVTFPTAPIGATVSGNILGNQILASLVVRANTDRPAPASITLVRQ